MYKYIGKCEQFGIDFYAEARTGESERERG